MYSTSLNPTESEDPLLDKKKPQDEYPLSKTLKMIGGMSMSPVFANLLHPAYLTISTMMLGQLVPDTRCLKDKVYKEANPEDCAQSSLLQSGFGMGHSLLSIILLAPLMTYSMSLQNFIPQAFGAKDFKACGQALNKICISLVVLAIPLILFIEISCHWLMAKLGVDKEVIGEATTYIRIVAPGILMMALSNCMIEFGTLQGRPIIGIWTKLIPSLIHLTLVYYLATVLDMRLKGIAISTLIHYTLRFLFSYSFVLMIPELNKCLVPFSESMDNWEDTIRIGFYSMLLKIPGWWAFDAFTQIAAGLPHSTDALAAQSILRNIQVNAFMIPGSLQTAANFFTGKFMGSGETGVARLFSNTCLAIAGVWAAFSASMMLVLGKDVREVYSNNPGVREKMGHIWVVITIFIVFDGLQGCLLGTITGLKLLPKFRYLTVLAYWVVGLPLALLLALHFEMNLAGLWYGATAAVLIIFVVVYVYLDRADWSTFSMIEIGAIVGDEEEDGESKEKEE